MNLNVQESCLVNRVRMEEQWCFRQSFQEKHLIASGQNSEEGVF